MYLNDDVWENESYITALLVLFQLYNPKLVSKTGYQNPLRVSGYYEYIDIFYLMMWI